MESFIEFFKLSFFGIVIIYIVVTTDFSLLKFNSNKKDNRNKVVLMIGLPCLLLWGVINTAQGFSDVFISGSKTTVGIVSDEYMNSENRRISSTVVINGLKLRHENSFPNKFQIGKTYEIDITLKQK